MVGNPVESLTLRDVLTRLVAGWYAASVVGWPVELDRTAALLALLLASYLAGELLEFVRSQAFPAPWPFVVRVRRAFPDEDRDSTVGGLRGFYATRVEFWSRDELATAHWPDDEPPGHGVVLRRLCRRYHDTYGAADPVDVYDYLLLEHGDEFSERTVRRQSVYRFWNSTRLAVVVAAPIVATTVGGPVQLALLALTILVVFSMLEGNVALDWLGETYTGSLFKEYRLASPNRDHNEDRAKSDPSS
jgi:hypothetical protein